MSALATANRAPPYTPFHPQINLGRPAVTQQISNEVSPLHYQLNQTDVTPVTIGGTTNWMLNPNIAVAIIFTLQRLESRVVTAGHYRIYDHIPILASNLHDQQFIEINLPRPTVLLLNNSITQFKPLFELNPDLERLHAMFYALQEIGREAVDWIATASERSTRFGPRTSWCFDMAFTRPKFVAPPADPRPRPSRSKYALLFKNKLLINNHRSDNCTTMVLHPTLSSYVKAYPNYDAFSGAVLIDNGYVADPPAPKPETRMIVHPTASSSSRKRRRANRRGCVAPPSSPASSSTARCNSVTVDVDRMIIDLTMDSDIDMD